MVEVGFREVVGIYIESQVIPQLIERARLMGDQVQGLTDQLQEVERQIAFNVELSTAELETIDGEDIPQDKRLILSEMILGPLERAMGITQGFVEKAQHWPTEISTQMRNAVLGALQELRGQLVDGEISRSRLESMRRLAAGRRIARQAEEIPSLLRQLRDQGKSALETVVGEQRFALWWKKLGLPTASSDPTPKPELFAPPTSGTEIPPVYLRLFNPDTLEAADVLTGRRPEIEQAIELLSSSAAGQSRAVALVGIDGVGKASVLNAVVRTGRWKKVVTARFDGPVTIEEVEDKFRDATDGSLVVIDGLHWLISVRPGGFEPLRRLVAIVAERRTRLAWLVHADVLLWKYANAIAHCQDAFPTTIHLQPLGREELKAAVLARHRLSGYGHAFDRNDGHSALEGIFARSASRIRRPFDQYFEELYQATGGLIRDALRLWVASIRKVDSDAIVHVGRVPTRGQAALSTLAESQLMILFQVARQGWMNADELSYLFRLDRAQCSAVLSRLFHWGLLEQRTDNESKGIYQIALHFRGSLMRLFIEKQWCDLELSH